MEFLAKVRGRWINEETYRMETKAPLISPNNTDGTRIELCRPCSNDEGSAGLHPVDCHAGRGGSNGQECVTITMTCEYCSNQHVLAVWNHKGITLMGWVQ